MPKLGMLALTAAVACAGCTTNSLERYTLDQIRTAADYRSQEVVNCLAAVAANPDALPSFAVLADGVTRVQDTENASSVTTWTRAVKGFALETFGLTLSRSPQGQWTLIPAAEYERQEAMRCACRWVIYGPESACGDCPGLLSDLQQDPLPRPHFAVADRLASLPRGWLHFGKLSDVPLGACYKGHCSDTWVWVMPEGRQGLADFSLVLYDIATLDLSAVYAPPPLVTLTRFVPTKIPDASGQADGAKGKLTVLSYQETRVIKPEFKSLIEQKINEGKKTGEVKITLEKWLAYSAPYHGVRTNVSPQGASGSPTPPTQNPVPVPRFTIDVLGPEDKQNSVDLVKPNDVTLVIGKEEPTKVTVFIKRNTYQGEVPLSLSFVGFKDALPKGIDVQPKLSLTIPAGNSETAFDLKAKDGAQPGTLTARVTITTPNEGKISEGFRVLVEKKKPK